MYLGALCQGYTLNCHFPFGLTMDTSVTYKKAPRCFVLIIYNSKIVKFSAVQTNVKQVSYLRVFSHIGYHL